MGSLVREARLKPEYADTYRGIPPGVWEVAGNMVEKLLVLGRRREVSVPGERVLNDEHFEFRGGRMSGPVPRQVRTRLGDR